MWGRATPAGRLFYGDALTGGADDGRQRATSRCRRCHQSAPCPVHDHVVERDSSSRTRSSRTSPRRGASCSADLATLDREQCRGVLERRGEGQVARPSSNAANSMRYRMIGKVNPSMATTFREGQLDGERTPLPLDVVEAVGSPSIPRTVLISSTRVSNITASYSVT